MKTLQQRIAEIESNSKLEKHDFNKVGFSKIQAFENGVISQARDAILVINELQEERDRYKSLWETNAVESEEIIRELKSDLELHQLFRAIAKRCRRD